jgi:hypothetical protein
MAKTENQLITVGHLFRKKLFLILAVLGIVLVAVVIIRRDNTVPTPASSLHTGHYRNSVSEPSAELKEATKSLQGIISDPADAVDVAQFYVDFADVIERDVDVIKTTGTIREGFIRAEKLMLQRTELVGKYPGFGAAKDKIVKDQLGLEDVQLSEEKREAAVNVFRAIAWSIQRGAP